MAGKDARLAGILTGRHLRASGLALIGAIACGLLLIVTIPVGQRPGKTPANTIAVPSFPAPDALTSGTPEARSTVAPTHEGLDHAAEALRDGRLETAANEYEAIAASAADAETKAGALLGAAVARFEGGEREASIARLREAVAIAPAGSAAGRRASYLLGRRLNEAGAFADAREVLRGPAVEPWESPLRDYVRAEFAKAAARGGDVEVAAAVWDSLGAKAIDDTLRASIWSERAALAKANGAPDEQAAWLTKLADLRGDPATRYELAGLAQTLGDEGLFARQLRAIISASPGAKEAVLAIADLRAAGFAVDAGQEGFVYYRRGAFAEARRVLGRAVDEANLGAAERAFRYYYLGAANEDGGFPAEAIRNYDLAAAQDAVSPYTHRGKWWAARVIEGLGDTKSASARYLDLAENGPSGEFSQEARFRAGYTLLRTGEPAAAVTVWERMALVEDAHLFYWKGRAYELLGDPERARAAYERATAAGTFDFYGIEAARALGRAPGPDVGYHALVKPPAPDWTALEAWAGRLDGIVPGAATQSAVGDLAAVGLRAEATDLVERRAQAATPRELVEVIREAYEAHLTGVASRLAMRARDAVGVRWEDAPKDLVRLAYPVDYVTQLDHAGEANGVSPLLVAALVRQESLWDAGAESRAGALGLTQVMPATGEGIARALAVEFRTADLLRPSVSLAFGAWYLGSQLRRFGDPHVALAAYNAGPGNARRWAEAWDGKRAADFVEGVDIDETQHYVEQVMEHYARYLAAYGG